MAGNTFGVDNHIGQTFQETTIHPSGTKVILLKGVPIDGSQKDQLWFESKADQENYFVGNVDLEPASFECSYVRKQDALRIDVNAEKLYDYNYLTFLNAQYGTHRFYAFITDVEYVTNSMSYVRYQIDVFQSWLFDVKFMPSYVKSMQQTEFRTNTLGWKVPYQRNQDEGLDYGKDYDIVKQIQITGETNPYIKWAVIVSSTMLEDGDSTAADYAFGSIVNGVPTPLFFYLTPLDSSNGKIDEVFVQPDPNKAPVLVAGLEMLGKLFKTDDSIAGKIISINLMDWCPVNISGSYPTYTLPTDGSVKWVKISKLGTQMDSTGSTKLDLGLFKVKATAPFRYYDIDLGNVYSYFNQYDHSKMMCSPYSMIELTDFKGHMQMIRPEYVHNSHLFIRVSTALSWQPKISYSVADYNVSDDNNIYNLWHSGGELKLQQQNWDTTIFDNVSGDIPVSTSASAAYLQSAKNSLRASKANMIDSQNTGFANALQDSIVNGVGNAFHSGVTGFMAGGPYGAAAGVGGSVLKSVAQGASTQSEMHRSAATSRANLIRSQQAKIADISNTPANIQGLGNSTIFESNNAINGVFLVFKQAKEEYMKKCQQFFHMFGYKTNNLIDLSVNKNCFHSRKCWNYVETENIKIVGHINSTDMQELKQIFNTGVTLWHLDTSGGILVGDYSQNNDEL